MLLSRVLTLLCLFALCLGLNHACAADDTDAPPSPETPASVGDAVADPIGSSDKAPAAASSAAQTSGPASDAADETAEPEPPAAPADGAAGDTVSDPPDTAGAPTAEDFEKLYGQWQAKLKRLIKLRNEYQGALAARRDEIKNAFTEMLLSGEQLLPSLSRAAEQKLIAEPDPDGEAASFLTEYVRDAMRQDNYEEAARLSDVLIEHKAGGKGMNELSGIAAFMIGNYDHAEKRFKEADQIASLGQKAKDARRQLDYYRKIWKEEQEFRAAEAEADDLPRVKLVTNKGDIVVELFENEAPKTVGNFVNLVEKKFYDGLAFHRVLPNFMAQGGDPNGDGTGGPGYRIPCECLGDVHRKHFRGSLSMAKQAEPNTGGSQFFLNFAPTQHLDGRHTVFGRVIEGMNVLSKLQRRNPQGPGAPQADKIVKAVVVRKRDHEYEPTRLPEG